MDKMSQPTVKEKTSVLSQKFVAEGVRVEAEIPKPRQGRYRVAHGVSHGIRALSPLRPPSPAWAGEGGGGKGGRSDPRLAPWATLCRPLCGLISLADL